MWRPPSREKDEQGAVSILVALVTVVLVGFSAFAVDLGMQRVGVRDMQALADVVSLDLARRIDGRTTAGIEADPAWGAALATSVSRNDDTFGEAPEVVAVLGVVDTSGFRATAASEVPSAVEVTASSTVQFVLAGVISDTTEGPVAGSAIAEATVSACFRLGSFAAKVSSGNSPVLNTLIGDALNASVLAYDGLASSDIALGDLALELGLGSVDELATTTVGFSTLLNAAATVLTRQTGDPDAAADAALLGQVVAAAGLSTSINLGKLFSLEDGGNAAKMAQVNVLDLVAGAAFVANGANALALPATTVTVAGLTNVTISVYVIEPPQIACGLVNEARAHTAQIRVALRGKMVNVNLGIARATLDVNLDLEVAQSTGTLVDATCGDGTLASPYGVDVNVAGGLTDLELALPTMIHTGGLINVNLLKLDVLVGTTDNGITELAQVRVPPLDYNTPVETGNGSIGLSGLAIRTANVSVLGLGVSLASILAPLTTTVVNPLVSAIDVGLLAPLTELFGVNLGGADVFLAPPEPDCSTPRLRG